jgi:hypothetical protein
METKLNNKQLNILKKNHRILDEALKVVSKSRKNFYWGSSLYALAFLAICIYAVTQEIYWLLPGLVIGGTYVMFAGFYYLDNLHPPSMKVGDLYLAQEKVENSKLTFDEINDIIKKNTDDVVKIELTSKEIRRRGSGYGVAKWILAPVLVQLTVVFWFWMTLVMSAPMMGSVYTHPVLYGQIYTRLATPFAVNNSLGANYPHLEKSDVEKNNTLRDGLIADIVAQHFRVKPYPDTAEKLKAECSGKKIISVGAEFKSDSCGRTVVCDILGSKELLKYFGSGEQLFVEDSQRCGVMVISMIPYLIAGSFAFLGVLIYTLRETTLRIFTKDLQPKTFIGFLVRFLFAPVVALIIAYSSSSNWPIYLGPMIFFYIGVFPQRAMQLIEEKAIAKLGLRGKTKKETAFSLDKIDGIDEHVEHRFRELGIRDPQHLAFVNLQFLRDNFGISNLRIGDLVSQALLFVYTRDDFEQIVQAGFRNILIIKELKQSGKLEEQMQKLDVKLQGKLQIISDLLQEEDLLGKRVAALQQFMERSIEEEEQDGPDDHLY